MPPHIHYVEPYFGAGSVLFAKDPEGVSEVANDLNGELMNFWRVLQRPAAFEEFRRVIEATPVAEARWSEAAAMLGLPFIDTVTRAVEFFIKTRQSLAARGECFTALSKTRVRRQMNEQAAAWLTAVEGLPAVHERLKRVVILFKPALDVIRQEDSPNTLFYLDPPYLHETRATTHEYGELEMGYGDHQKLLDTIKQCKGKVMLSGYRSPLYDTELRDWTRHEKQVANHASHKRTKGRETECVWCNF